LAQGFVVSFECASTYLTPLKMRVCTLLLSLVIAMDVTPVQKVVTLLEGMVDKGKAEKKEEQITFNSYRQFCDDTTTEKNRAIKEANEKMEQLNAAITKAEADAATLTKQIAKLDEDVSVWSGDQKTATEVRELEAADYAATHKDYSESVASLDTAVAALSKSDGDVGQLLQIATSTMIPDDVKNAVTSFVSQSEDAGANLLARDLAQTKQPASNAYEFQSAGIVDMLSKLHDKFEDERTALENKEADSKHAYKMLTQDLTAQIEGANAEIAAKSQEKATKLTQAASDKGELADTTATRDSDQTYVNDLDTTCKKKSSEFESRQQLRTEELEAIAKAIEIMSGDAISGGADHLPSLVQKSTSFIQISSSPLAQARVAEFLKEKADQLNSRVLSALATHAESDPFGKVRTMIKDLIVRLMEEANEEGEHKGWCDGELNSNEQTRKEKTANVETLHAELDELSASIAKGTQEIQDLNDDIAELDANMATATELRHSEKAENEQAIADAQAASAATSSAVGVLKEFYEKAGQATVLVQTPAPFDTPYQGMQSENGGVLGMLEVIASDFARLEADTKSSEAQSQKEFDAFSTESAANKAQNNKDVDHKTTKKINEESAHTMKSQDLTGTQTELDTALAYYDKLKPTCIDSGVNFEDRVARREEELASLQEALKILAGEDIAFLQK